MTKEEVIEYIKKYRELDIKLYTIASRNFTSVSENVVNKYLGYWDMAINALEQEPKTGHWIDTGSGQQCSECGEIQYGYDNYRRYCAYCGCKMESEE